MAKTDKKDENQNLEFLESSEAIQEQLSKGESFARKNINIIIGVAAAIAVGVGGFWFYNYNIQQQNATAQLELFPAQFYFEKDSLNKALVGDNNTTSGFENIAGEYGATPAGNIAHFYAGTAYLKKGQFDEAIAELKEFSADDLFVQARAYSLIGDAYMEKESYSEAISYYNKAADYKPNDYFTPVYLEKLALALELSNDYQGAHEAYKRITDEFKEYPKLTQVKKDMHRTKFLAK